MNNLTLGNDDFTYYETLGGGQGACPDADGPSAVHVAMSNTLNTPVEALELEFPLRVVQLRDAARLAAAPARYRGGDGVDARARGADRHGVLADHRAPPPRAAAAPRAAADGARGPQPARRRELAGQGRRARCAPGSDCASRRRAAAGTARGNRAAAGIPGRRAVQDADRLALGLGEHARASGRP